MMFQNGGSTTKNSVANWGAGTASRRCESAADVTQDKRSVGPWLLELTNERSARRVGWHRRRSLGYHHSPGSQSRSTKCRSRSSPSTPLSRMRGHTPCMVAGQRFRSLRTATSLALPATSIGMTLGSTWNSGFEARGSTPLQVAGTRLG